MQTQVIQAGALSKRIKVFIQDATTFMGLTGLAFNTAGLSFYYSNGNSDSFHLITLVTNTVGGAYSAGSFKEIDATHAPGWYQFDIPNEAIASGNGSIAVIAIKGTGVLDAGIDIELTDYDPDSIDKSGFLLSSAGVLAIWNQLLSALTTSSTVGKLLADNIAASGTGVAAIKAKTDALLLTNGRVQLAANGMDQIPGYHPAGDA